jgi:spermidine/putrescine transport system substrate-binding protein
MPITRRSVLKGAAAAVAAPAILRAHDALASSGQVNVFAWQDYIQPNIAEKFTAETGIALNLTTYGSNDEAASTLVANGGKGFDVIMPSITNRAQYESPDAPNGIFLQPIDESKANLDAVIPSFLRDSVQLGATKDGHRYLIPFDWGTEGVTLNRAALDVPDEEISYGNLWVPEAVGKASFRQKSGIVGVGLYLDAIGEVPSNRMLDVYKTEDDARRVWSAVTQWMLERKQNFGAFWNNATEATAAFKEAGCIVGQTWDTTGLLLNRENPDYVYRAPKEGLITWLDSIGIPSGAENLEQAYAFINFLLTPEVGGMFANNTGYNSAVSGAADYASEEFKRQFNEVYREDVLNNMWWWQADQPFTSAVTNEFVEIITNA